MQAAQSFNNEFKESIIIRKTMGTPLLKGGHLLKYEIMRESSLEEGSKSKNNHSMEISVIKSTQL